MSKKNMMTDIEDKMGEKKTKQKEKPKKQKKDTPDNKGKQTPEKKQKSQKPKRKADIWKADENLGNLSNEEIKEMVILKQLNSQKRHPHPIRISQEILEKARKGSEEKDINLWEYISLAIYRQLKEDGLI